MIYERGPMKGAGMNDMYTLDQVITCTSTRVLHVDVQPKFVVALHSVRAQPSGLTQTITGRMRDEKNYK